MYVQGLYNFPHKKVKIWFILTNVLYVVKGDWGVFFVNGGFGGDEWRGGLCLHAVC